MDGLGLCLVTTILAEDSDLHVVGITTNGKRKTARNLRVLRGHIRILKSTSSKYRLLRAIKCYRAKLVPIINERVFGNDLVDGYLALKIL